MKIPPDRKPGGQARVSPPSTSRRAARAGRSSSAREYLNRIWVLRKVLNPMSPVEAMELLIDKMGKSRSNADFPDALQKMGRSRTPPSAPGQPGGDRLEGRERGYSVRSAIVGSTRETRRAGM